MVCKYAPCVSLVPAAAAQWQLLPKTAANGLCNGFSLRLGSDTHRGPMTIPGRDADWSTSRIGRLLRPLKCKCLALSSYVNQAPTGTTTYGSRQLPSSQELSSLHAPFNIGVRIHFSRDTVQTLELSKRIYAIRDCYSDLISKAHASRPAVNTRSPTLLSLASLCSVILGAQIPCHDQEEPAYDTQLNSSQVLLAAIPPAYRLRTLLMHALHIILDSCPPCASLYLALLDLTLARRLYHESEVLLDQTLEHAFESSRDHPPRILNPIHRRFLVEIYYKWHTQFPSSTYVRLVTAALQRASLDAVWTSKATKLFARKIGRYDITLLPTLLCGLMDAILTRRIKLKDKRTETNYLTKQLSEWFNICTDFCTSSIMTLSDTELTFENETLVEDILDHCRSRVSQSDNDLSGLHFVDAIACFYALWLVRKSPESRTINRHDALYSLLQRSSPSSSTFTPICLQIFRLKPLDECEDILRILSSALIRHGLSQLQASLWACGLYCIEKPDIEQMLIDKSDREHVRDVRLRLVDYVEEAESRCFGGLPFSYGAEVSWGPEVPYDEDEAFREPAIEWDWKPTIGRWVRSKKSQKDHLPATPKRRKIANCRHPSSERLSHSESLCRIRSNGGTTYSRDNYCDSDIIQPAHRASSATLSIDENPSLLFRSTLLFNGTLPARSRLNRGQLEDEDGEKTITAARVIDLDGSDETDTDDDEHGDGDNLSIVDPDQVHHAPSEDFLDLFRINTSPAG